METVGTDSRTRNSPGVASKNGVLTVVPSTGTGSDQATSFQGAKMYVDAAKARALVANSIWLECVSGWFMPPNV